MLNNKELIDKLTKDKIEIEKQIKNYKLYNTRNKVLHPLIKLGLKVDTARPYFLTGLVISMVETSLGNAPFIADDIVVSANIETIDTSSGIHLQNISYDMDYKEKIEYSTGWQINDDGTYSRTLTTYSLISDVDLTDTNKILSFSKEELEKILDITNIEVITKTVLSPDDFIYDNSAVIVTNTYNDKNYQKKRPENSKELIFHSSLYLLITMICGFICSKYEKKFFKFNLQDRLKTIESKCNSITNDDLIILKKILKLKEENLRMLDEKSENIPSYQLRKK